MLLFWYLLFILSLFGKDSESAILRTMDDINEFYIELRNTDTQNSDPFVSFTREQRAAECQELLEHRIYTPLLVEHTIPDSVTRDPRHNMSNNMQAQNDIPGDPPSLQYNPITITLQEGKPEAVRAFICLQLPDYTWYLTYGFDKNYRFVLESKRTDSPVHILGHLETTRVIDTNLYGQDHRQELEKLYQRKLIRSVTESIPDHPGVCQLSANHQFFVCISLHDAWSKIEKWSQVTEHYVYIKENQCSQEDVQLLEENNLHEIHLDLTKIQVQLLPCAIDSGWENPDFYLAADPFDRYAVFMVQYNSADGFHFVAHVPDIVYLDETN